MRLLKTKKRKRHLCYYGYTRTPWYRVYCRTCDKVVKNNLPMLVFAGILLISFIFASGVIFLKF